MSWSRSPIGSFGRVVTGKTPPKSKNKYWNGDRLFVSPKDMGWDSRYILKTSSSISTAALEKFKNQLLPKNAVMFTALSFGFGKIGIASEFLLTNQQINSIVANNDNNFRFIYYLLRASKPYIFAFNSGIDTPIVPKSVFEKIELATPLLPEQQKIAAILTAYDDLIENNRQRIALLEKMAEEIYREWFVRLRFPGHENTPVHKGLPEGWCRAPIGTLAALVKRGISPRYDDESQTLVLNQKCIRNGSIDLTPGRKHSTNTPDKKFVQLFDVLVNSTGVGTLGRTAIVDFSDARITVDSHITICRADDQKIEPLYFGFTIKLFETVFENLAAGATGQTELSAALVKRLEIFKPPQRLQEKFADLLQPMLREKHILAQQNAELSKARDLLLNRLISGKLRVDDLDIQFPPSMQEPKAA